MGVGRSHALSERPNPFFMRYLCDEYRHLICQPYSVENLHKMAHALGIKRCWYHAGTFPHYDIPKRRIEEIAEKCEIVNQKTILMIAKGL